MRIFLNGKAQKVSVALDNLEQAAERVDEARLRVQALAAAYRGERPCPIGDCMCHKRERPA